jgi:hypothetical protein
MGTILKTAYLLLIIFTGVVSNAQAWTEPVFSRDTDTLYVGRNSVLRCNPPIPPIVDTTPRHGDLVCDWGEEIRLTYTDTDSTYGASSPRAYLLGDTVLAKYSYLLREGPRSSGQHIIYSTNFGVSWSAPHDFHNPGCVIEHIEDIVYGDGRLYVAGVDSRDTYNHYGPFFREATGLDFAWGDPVRFLNLDALFVGDSRVRVLSDTLFFIYDVVIGPFNNTVDSIYFCRSFNGGATWEEPRAVTYCRGASDGLINFETPSGLISVVYASYAPTGAKEIYQLMSLDGGETWGSRMLSADDSIHSQLPGMSRDPWGDLLVTWMDYQYGSGGGGFTGNILCRVSRDNGQSWGPIRRTTTQPTALLSASIIGGGYLGVVWVDFREGILLTELYFSESFDSGASWSEELRLTYSAGDVFSPVFVSCFPRGILLWEDSRDYHLGSYEIYLKAFETMGSGTNEDNTVKLRAPSIACYPNPSDALVTIEITGTGNEEFDVEIYDIMGRKVYEMTQFGKQSEIAHLTWNGKDRKGKEVSSGIYFIYASTATAKTSMKLLLLR